MSNYNRSYDDNRRDGGDRRDGGGDRRGGYDNRRGNDDYRGGDGYQDNRGNRDNYRGGYDNRDGGYQDNRGGNRGNDNYRDNDRYDNRNRDGGYQGNRDNYRGGNDNRDGGYRGGNDNYRGNDRYDNRRDYQDRGNQGGYQDRGDYQNRGGRDHGDNLNQQMGRMGLGGGRGGGGNMYAQQRSGPRPQRSAAGMANPGDLAGSADHPNMPVAKKDLAHNSQTFAKRPETSAYDNPRCGTKIELLTNHSLVHLPHEPIELHEYNIDVFKGRKKLEKREEAGPMFREIASSSGKKDLASYTDYVYNDVNLLWSTKKLPRSEGQVPHSQGAKNGYIYYKYTRKVELGSEVRNQDSQLLSTLVDAIATARVRWPKKIGNQFSVFKRSIFLLQNHVDDGAFGDAPLFVKLRNGVDARIGVSMGIKLNLRVGITACFDVSHTLFTRPGYPLVRLFWELIHGDTLTDEEIVEGNWDADMKLARPTYQNIKLMSDVLKDMRIMYTNKDGLKFDEKGNYEERDLKKLQEVRGFKFYQFSDNCFYEFYNESAGKNMSVKDFYSSVHGYEIRYPHLPCLQKKPTKKNTKKTLYPLEVCSLLIDPVRYTGLITEKLKGNMIQYTTLKAEQRKLVLQNIIGQKAIGDCPPIVDNNDRYMTGHGITIDKEMLTVKATLLPPPKVIYGNSDFLDSEHLGEWEAVTNDPVRTVLEDAIFKRSRVPNAPKLKKRILGCILKIGSPMNSSVDFGIDDMCYHNLMKAIEEAGQPVCWANPGQAVIHASEEYLQGRDQAGVTLDWMRNLSKENLDSYKKSEDEVIVPLVLMIFQVRFTTLNCERAQFQNDYNLFKWMADNEVGVFTQGLLYKTFNSIGHTPASCKFTRLLVEKILGKIGTTHRRLERDGDHKSWKKFVDPKEPTLVLGVDVSHPSARDLKGDDPVKRLSVATVVGNIDVDCTEFRASSKLQDVGEERIVRFEVEIQKRIGEFAQFNGKFPKHIVIYRDGLSEGDFQRTLYEEKTAVETACKEFPGIETTLTYIVVTKRHHTRFFLKDEQQGLEQQGFNVRPGTLVEDTVTTTDYYDFFLTTQVGQVGLARPTHYYVLLNDWKVAPTFWPTITHALTYLFCRTTSTVTLPAPVLYAHLAAKRAKETMDGALFANEGVGRRFDLSQYSDLAQLTNCLQPNPNLDGMTFV
ncbi:unnamed protein product [Caenorhabditis nigoni]